MEEIDKQKKFKIICKHCGKVDHIISSRSRNRGVKLSCFICGNKTCWHNLEKLENRNQRKKDFSDMMENVGSSKIGGKNGRR